MSRQKVVVTGGSLGIGRSIAIQFAKNGYDVAVCSRNEKNLVALASDLGELADSNHIIQVCDVSDKGELEQFWKLIEDSWGGVDVLVNNAGQFIPGRIQDEEEGILEKLFKTNLMSTYHMSRMVIPSMKKNGKGYIVNICSTASIGAYANGGSYSITKYAQYGLTKNLREELMGDNIGVTAILPGPTFTNSWAGIDLPEDRFIDPDDIGELVYQTVQFHPRSVVEEIIIRPQEGDIA